MERGFCETVVASTNMGPGRPPFGSGLVFRDSTTPVGIVCLVSVQNIMLVGLSSRVARSVNKYARSFSTQASGTGQHRAAVLQHTGGVTGFEETMVDAVGPSGTQVRVKVNACGVGYLDVMNRTGAFPFIKTPVILGHEIAGTVVEVGDAAGKFKAGDKVVSVHWAQKDSWPSPLTKSGPVPSLLGLNTNVSCP